MCQQQRTDLIWTHYSALTASLWIPPIKDKPARSLDTYIYIWWFPFEFYEPREKHKLKFIEPNWRWSRNWLKKCYFSEYTTFYCRLSYINLATHTHMQAKSYMRMCHPCHPLPQTSIYYMSQWTIYCHRYITLSPPYTRARARFLFIRCAYEFLDFGRRRANWCLLYVRTAPKRSMLALIFFSQYAPLNWQNIIM